MKRIIVNADDFGINEVVTAEIERQITEGRVSSTTIMANGQCLDEVKRFATQHLDISFGVHLCLSEFGSLTQSDGLRNAGIIDDDGSFIHKAIFRLDDYKTSSLRQAIHDELNAQIDVVESLGIPISHADSHHHVHTIYPLREVFAEVLRSHGINKVRKGGDFHTLRMKLHLLKWNRRVNLNKYYSDNFFTTDGFYSFEDFVTAGMPVTDGQIIELMCHPGHPGARFQDEIRMMENTTLSDDIKLVSYNDLH